MLRGLGSTLRTVELELDGSIQINDNSGRMLIASISTMTALQTAVATSDSPLFLPNLESLSIKSSSFSTLLRLLKS